MQRWAIRCLTAVVLAAMALPVAAHEIWFAQRSKQLALIYGNGSEDLDTFQRLAKFTFIKGYDSAGKPVVVSLKSVDPMVFVNVDQDPAVITATMDNGVWSKDKAGAWHAAGKDKIKDAVISGHNYKYTTFLRKLPTGATTPVSGPKLQLVAVGKVFPKKKGDTLTVQVLFDGQPVPGVRVYQDMVTAPSDDPLLADEDGVVTLPVRNDGLNVVMAMHVAAPEDPATTFMTEHVATLCFMFPPPAE